MTMLRDTESLRSVSIYDVARQARVSAVTVSRVYSGKATVAPETRERVLKVATALGYRRNPLAAALRGASSHTVGILWSGHSSSISNDITRALQRGLEKRDYVAMAVDHFHEWKRTIALLEEMRLRAIDAIIIQAQQYLITHPQVATILDERPCVVVSYQPFETKYDLIVHDRTEAYRQVLEYFISAGRKRILMVTDMLSGRWKHEAVKRLLKELGAQKVKLELLDTSPHGGMSNADSTWRSFSDNYPAGSRFDHDAVICESDTRSLVIHRWLTERGISVPDDVAIVGSNNEHFAAYYQPPLATMDYRYGELAQIIERVLFKRFEEPEAPPIRVHLNMEFIHRASAG